MRACVRAGAGGRAAGVCASACAFVCARVRVRVRVRARVSQAEVARRFTSDPRAYTWVGVCMYAQASETAQEPTDTRSPPQRIAGWRSVNIFMYIVDSLTQEPAQKAILHKDCEGLLEVTS